MYRFPDSVPDGRQDEKKMVFVDSGPFDAFGRRGDSAADLV